jgi:hypothetical protein
MRRVRALVMVLVAVWVLLRVSPGAPVAWHQAQELWDLYRPDFGVLVDALDLDELPAQAGRLWTDHRHEVYATGAWVSVGLIVGGICEAGAVAFTAGSATPLCFAAGLAVAGSVHGGVGDAVLWAILGAGYGWLLRRGAAPPGARVVPGRHRPRMLLRTRAR